jgi:predicted phage terminase large subunit-like protein
MRFAPQKGAQTKFLSSNASIVIYGGSAGGGKTYGLLLNPIRYIDNEKYGAVIFRQNYTQIHTEGGLLDESLNIYSHYPGAHLKKSAPATWYFPSGAKVSFNHIERYSDVFKFQGGQINAILFDELTHFEERTFFYMLSRNRSVSGIKPYIRATCNADADSWVARFIEWWIDQETGYPIKERSGVIRWFIRRNEQLYWADTAEELWEQFNLKTDNERLLPRSVTFIASTLYDNKILMDLNPEYLANLEALAMVERERLLHGNWKIKPAAGMYFRKTQIGEMLRVLPDDVVKWVRAWDLAATAEDEGGDPAYTSGVLMGKRKSGRFIVADVINKRLNADEVRKLVTHTAQRDNAMFKNVKVRLPQDPGQAGKEQAKSYIKMLAGFSVKAVPESGSKESRAEPMAAQWQGGNFDMLIAPWNDMYTDQLESFPMSKYKDMVDASTSAFSEVAFRNTGFIGA